MALPLILAMTAAEISTSTSMPESVAWMACHFPPMVRESATSPPDFLRAAL